MNTTIATVVSKLFHGEVVELRVRKPIGFSFTPGQCIDVYKDADTFRTYSIGSGIQQDSIILYVKRLPGGEVSTWLYENVKEGDSLRISKEAYGFFEPGNTDKPFAFIATGTGVAPFLSYIASYGDLAGIYGKKPEMVVYGVRHLKEVIPVFTSNVTYCLSKDTIPNDKFFHQGRVTDYLKTISIDVNTVYYICGLDSAIRDVSNYLFEQGVPFENIITEVFYFSLD